MPVRFLSDAQREQLSGFPAEFDDEALDRLFTLSGADLVEARRRRGDGNRLGWSLLLCGLRMLGFCPDDVTTAPVVAVRFVARQLGVDPAVLAFAAQRVVELTDELVDLFDKLLGDTNAKARKRLGDYQQSIAAAANDKVLLLAEIARVLLDPDLEDDNRLAALFAAVPKGRLEAALADCDRIARPADNSHIDLLGDHYSKLRQCVPRLLEVLTFRSHRDAGELLAGIEVLRELNRTGRRKVPRDAPLTFVPKAWMPFVASGQDTVSRRFWELALLWRLRDGLRSGDVWVQGSQRYADPETYLLGRERWAGMRGDYCTAVRHPRSGAERIAQLGRELDEELASFEAMLARGEGPVRLEDDRLVVGRDTGDDLPASVKQFKTLLGEVFPQVELAEVVIAIDSVCGFSKHLLHAGGAKNRTPAMLIHLYAAILAQATNLGPVAMARASGLSYDQVAHATAWYLREETLTPAIDAVINYHHRLPAARLWGDGTFASSDGQRFPVQVKAANAGALPRYFGFGRGLSVLTSVTDHYATFGTKVIPTRLREGLYALDEIFALRERDSELTIAEHTTDTAGFTDLLFGAYDVVGLLFCPRIRDLADQRLWLPAQAAPPKLVAPLAANRVTVEPILAWWDDLLRLGASIHEGEVPPSLLLTKLQAFPRQNALARALQDYGRLVKTLFILRYLQRPEMRKRVGRQLNKGENLNGLRETVYFAHLGQIRHRQLLDQTAQALCVTLVVNCIAAYNAGLLSPAVHRLRAAGFPIEDADVCHAGPTMSEHILVHGRYHYDLDRPPKQLRPAPTPQRDLPRGLHRAEPESR